MAHPPSPSRTFDVDLMRDLLFELETRQVSPRSTVFVSIDDQAIALDRSRAEIEFSLTGLLDLDYIDGPGMDEGFFLFRKLTRKGNEFLRATRRARDWDKMKQHFAMQRIEGER